MNYKDIDIEKWAREVAREETAAPPASAWQKIQNNLSAAAPYTTPKRKAPAWIWAIVGALIATAMMLWQASRTEKEEPLAAATLPSQSPTTPTATKEKTQQTIEVPATTAHTAKASSSKSRQTIEQKPATTTVSQPAAAATTHAVAAPQPAATKKHSIATGEPIAPTASQASQHTATQPSAQATDTPNDETTALTSEETTAAAPLHDTPLQEEKNNLFIPNLITPNGDGINDYWVIPALQDYEDVQVAIFTAQGKRIYSNSHYHGEFSGSDLEEGTYFYQVVVKSAQIHRRGALVIRR